MEKWSKSGRKFPADRFPELPEWIIHDQIMSRLSKRDRARTSVLSKTWYHLNKTYPSLDFTLEDLSQLSPFSSFKTLKFFRDRSNESMLYFSHKKLRLRSLRVSNPKHFYPDFASDLNRWVELGLENRLEKLKLYCCEKPPPYQLPQSVYYASTLTTLKLSNCVLDQQLSEFRSLRKLTLSECQLISGPLVLKHPDFPVLESLNLYHCSGFDSIRIPNLARLHRVVIVLNIPMVVEIASQSIEKMSIECCRDSPWSNISISGCSALKFLHLKSNRINYLELHCLLLKFTCLEDLYVMDCDEVPIMRMPGPPWLKTLVVTNSRHKVFRVARCQGW